MNKFLNSDSDDFVPSKQPMKRQKPRDYENQGKKGFKDDKRKRREAFERKRGG